MRIREEEVMRQIDAELHQESRAYDHGHRIAIRAQTQALLTVAREQANRSEQTARRPLGTDEDRQNHTGDKWFYEALLHILRPDLR